MLFRKMLRDIKWNKMQFISIFLMSFLGVFVFAGISGEYTGVEQVRKEYYEKTNLADGWIYGDGFLKEDEEAVSGIRGVTAVQRRFVIEAIGDEKSQPAIQMYFQEGNAVSKPYIIEGKDYDTDDTESVWMDKRFADAEQLKAGDTYTYVFGKIKKEFKIAGLILAPEYGYYQTGTELIPDFSKGGYAYCSAKAFPAKEYIIQEIRDGVIPLQELTEKMGLEEKFNRMGIESDKITLDMILPMLEDASEETFRDMLPYTQLIFTTDEKDVPGLEKKLDTALDGGYAAFVDRDSIVGISMLDSEMKQHKVMSGVFPVAFMVIAVLAIITTMNRLVTNQRTQIGTLKALGVKKRKIVNHYICYSFFLSLTGALFGAVSGPLTIPYLFFPPLSDFYTLPEWRAGFSPLFFIVAAATVAACTVTTYLSCRKVLNVNPAETLRPAPPRSARRSLLEKTRLWKKLGFTRQYNLRDISRSKVRTLMGFAGTLSCMALLVCAFAMYDSMNGMITWMYDTIENYETKMLFDETVSLEQAQQIQEDVNGELIMSSSIEIKKKDTKETVGITVVDEHGIYQVTDTKQNSRPLQAGEIAITMKLAKRLGIKAGDEITWHLSDSEKWVTSKVTMINRMPAFSGILMSKDAFGQTGYDFKPSYTGTSKQISSYDNEHIVSRYSRQDLYDAMNESIESMIVMVICLIVMAIILAVVVLYNLGLLSFSERERELATLKVIGFKTGKLRKLLLVQNTWLAILGVAAGAPAGLWLVQVMCDASGDSFDMIAQMSVQTFCISAVITLGVSIMVSTMFSGKIKKLDMVASLKGVE